MTGYYYPFLRDGFFEAVAFEDLTTEERAFVFSKCDEGMRERLVEALAAEIARLKADVERKTFELLIEKQSRVNLSVFGRRH